MIFTSFTITTTPTSTNNKNDHDDVDDDDDDNQINVHLIDKMIKKDLKIIIMLIVIKLIN